MSEVRQQDGSGEGQATARHRFRRRINPALLDLFERNGIVSAYPGHVRWREGDPLAVNPYAKIEPYSHLFEGYVVPRAFGAFSYSHSELDLAASVGRYCSISLGVQLMGSPHPTDWVSSSSYFYAPQYLRGFAGYFADRGLTPPAPMAFDEGDRWVRIGHDVWIGAQAMIKREVTIGNGAIIGARALVTRDVPPYAIVAGTPARILRYRFPDALIERFERVQWWRFGPDLVQSLDPSQPEPFLDRLEAEIARGAQPLALEPVTGRQILDIAA